MRVLIKKPTKTIQIRVVKIIQQQQQRNSCWVYLFKKRERESKNIWKKNKGLGFFKREKVHNFCLTWQPKTELYS